MQIERPGALRAVELPEPQPGPNQLLVRVHACGVCRTDLHLLDGEVEIPRPPIVPGHQIVGTVKRSTIYRMRFEPQDHKFSVGADVFDPATGKFLYFHGSTVFSLTYPWVDPDGTLWSCDFLADSIVRYSPDGSKVTQWPFPFQGSFPAKIRRLLTP